MDSLAPTVRISHSFRLPAMATFIEGENECDKYIAAHCLSAITPFVSKKVLIRLQNVAIHRDKVSHQKQEDESIVTLEQPSSINVQYTMRDYQLKGISWLLDRYDHGLNCILADEMGLGKTLQTIAFITYLKDVRKVPGPHLVVVPLRYIHTSLLLLPLLVHRSLSIPTLSPHRHISVLFNWISECKKFCPSLRLLRLHTNDRTEVASIRARLIAADFDLCVTTYEMVKSTSLMVPLQRVVWRTVVLDEGHRIKNLETEMSKACGHLRSRFKLILTGTPVQNNMGETYALLHFLMPKVFDARDAFDECFALTTKEIKVDRSLLNEAHYMLRPFVLRRIKAEVEQKLPPKLETMVHCPMSGMQKFWTKMLLMKDAMVLTRLGGGAAAASDQASVSSGSTSSASTSTTATAAEKAHDSSSKGQDWRKLQSLLAQLRKAANHPYLFPGAESNLQADGAPSEEIVTASGKMVMLDRMLTKLQERGHRVVVFSQYTRTLDILSGEWVRVRARVRVGESESCCG